MRKANTSSDTTGKSGSSSSPPIRLLRTREVAEITGLSQSAVRHWESQGMFPPAIRSQQPRATRWRSDVIQDWIEKRSNGA